MPMQTAQNIPLRAPPPPQPTTDYFPPSTYTATAAAAAAPRLANDAHTHYHFSRSTKFILEVAGAIFVKGWMPS